MAEGKDFWGRPGRCPVCEKKAPKLEEFKPGYRCPCGWEWPEKPYIPPDQDPYYSSESYIRRGRGWDY